MKSITGRGPWWQCGRVGGREWTSGRLLRQGGLGLMRDDEGLNQARGDAEGPDLGILQKVELA